MARKVRVKSALPGVARSTAKDRLITGMVAARRNILDKVVGISADRQDEVFLGKWSVKDLIAHLIGWDYTCLAAVQELLAGELPSFYSVYDEDWESYNRTLVRQYGQGDWNELLSAVRQSHEKLLDYLRRVPDEDFGADWGVRFQGTPVTIERLVDAEIKDDREHFRQINRWMG